MRIILYSLTACLYMAFMTHQVYAVSLSKAQINRFSNIIETEMAAKGLPNVSITLTRGQNILWSAGFGALAGGRTADENTVYRIGSISKLFTAVAIMQLQEQGRLDIDLPVKTYLPDFAPENPFGVPITVRHLLSHQSGLVREPQRGNYFATDEISLAETVRSLNETKLVAKPGTIVKYSNAGIAVVGRVLEIIEGKPFADVLKTNILDKIGMENSAFEPEAKLVARSPKGLMWNYQGERFDAPTFKLGMSPAGSMYSTTYDLAAFLRSIHAIHQKGEVGILSKATLDKMWGPQDDGSHARHYGLGFGITELEGQRVVKHGGAVYGFASELMYLPETGLGVAISTNLDVANGSLVKMAHYFLRSLLAEQQGSSTPDYLFTKPIPKETAIKYSGAYIKDDDIVELNWRLGHLYYDRLSAVPFSIRQAASGRYYLDDVDGFEGEIQLAENSFEFGGETYRRMPDMLPTDAPKKWRGLIGEYGWDHNILYILEKYGKLHALIEWETEYPLTEQENDQFDFPKDRGLYPLESLQFIRDENGRATEVRLGNIIFPRRNIEPQFGGTAFKFDMSKGIQYFIDKALKAKPPVESSTLLKPALVDIPSYDPSIKLDIRYATNNSLLGAPVYKEGRAFTRREAAEALVKASAWLKTKGYGLLIHDAYRPWYVNQIFWDSSPDELRNVFITNPKKGSRHNRGSAVDITLYHLDTGEPMQAVALYDELSSRSYPDYPGGTSRQRWQRNLLRRALETVGYTVYETEWWHFDFRGWQSYAIQNDTFENIMLDK